MPGNLVGPRRKVRLAGFPLHGFDVLFCDGACNIDKCMPYVCEGRKKYFTFVNFSERFRDLVEGSGRTQREVAEALRISEASIINYRRDRTPKAEELLRIAQYFHVTMEWLMTGDDDRQPRTPDGWKQRAMAAEEKVQMLKSGMEGLLKRI